MRNLILLVFIILGFHSFGQHSIIVKFNYADLDYSVIDDGTVINLPLIKALNLDGLRDLEYLKTLLPEIENYTITKVFPFLNTNDSISVSRLGQIVTIPPFWAVFRMEIPENVQLKRTINTLNNYVPLIEYAHFDFAVDFQSTPNDSLYLLKQKSLFDPLGQADINAEEAWDIETGKRFCRRGA